MSEIEDTVIERIRARRDIGRAKYGVTMERTDLSREAWLRHAQEEALDLAIYLEKLGQVETDRLPTVKDVQDVYELARLSKEVESLGQQIESFKIERDSLHNAIRDSNSSLGVAVNALNAICSQDYLTTGKQENHPVTIASTAITSISFKS